MSNSNQSHNIYENTFGHSLKSAEAAGIAAYFIFLIVGGITFNAILVHAILLKKRIHATSISFIEQQQSTTNTFVINLAVCDLLTAISTLPFDADFLLRGHYMGGIFLCGLKETFFMFSLPASIVNLLLLTCERFIKLLYPFKHGKIYTKVNILIIILASWTYILAVALLPIMMNRNAVVIENGRCALHFTKHYTLYQLFGNFSIPVLIIVTMNLILYYYVGKRSRSMKTIKDAANKRRGTMKSTRHSLLAIPVNFKAAKTIMTLVVVFLICWLTFIITVTVNISCGVCLPRLVTWIVNAINYSSVALNPVIYGLFNKSIRQMLFKKYLRCIRKKKHFNLRYSSSSFNSIRTDKRHSCVSLSIDGTNRKRSSNGLLSAHWDDGRYRNGTIRFLDVDSQSKTTSSDVSDDINAKMFAKKRDSETVL